jgi:hypothetical protein
MKLQNRYDHIQAQNALQSKLDGSMDDEQVKQLEQHLEGCAECRAYAAQMTEMDHRLKSSLQPRWPNLYLSEANLASKLAEIQPLGRKNQMKNMLANTARNFGWAALVIILIAGLVWTFKTLAPIPSQGPAGLSTPLKTEAVLRPTQLPPATSQVTPEGTPIVPTTAPLIPGVVDLLPNVVFNLPSEMPSSPESLTLFRQQLSQAVTADSARQVADQWGIAGGVYSSPSEGMNDIIFDVMDGARSIRFLNFPDQFIYDVGYASPDYGSALMDNGPLPSFDEQVAIATNFLKPFGILDLPYKTIPLETERGIVSFIPLLDGFPVVQEIGVDRSNIGWINVKVNTPGQVTEVRYSHHDFQPAGSYPILTAQQAWDRFSNDSDLQHSRYAVLSPEGSNTYQAWVRKFQPGQSADIYGWVNTYSPADSNSLSLVMINNLPIIGDTAGMSPANKFDVRFVHAWGQIQGSPTDGVALNIAGWEISPLTDEYITGTLTTQSGQTQLMTTGRTFTLLDPPSDIPDGIQVGIQAVVLDGNPPMLNWKFIETGQIPFSYGASNSCGGGGGGGYNLGDANFGGGNFALVNVNDQTVPVPTQATPPYQPGDEINAATGNIYVTRHLYLGGKTSTEVIFLPDPSSGMDLSWAYSLVGDNLSGIEQYNNLPIKIWGQVDRLDKNPLVYITINRYEPAFPGEQIQAWTGTDPRWLICGLVHNFRW